MEIMKEEENYGKRIGEESEGFEFEREGERRRRVCSFESFGFTTLIGLE